MPVLTINLRRNARYHRSCSYLNERENIGRSLERLQMLKEVIVLDSFSTDETRGSYKSLLRQFCALDTHTLSEEQREVFRAPQGCIDGWIDRKALPKRTL